MAGRKIGSQKKVIASTILEVVISMVIIVTVFGTAMMIYANVMRLSLSVKKIRAQALLHDIMIKAEETKDLTCQSYHMEDFRVEQEVKTEEGYKGLIGIHLTAYDDNQEKIAEMQLLITKADE